MKKRKETKCASILKYDYEPQISFLTKNVVRNPN